MRVGLSCSEGNGVEADELRGHAWILIAAADGSESAQSYRDLLDEHIEKDQIAKAQKLADEIMRANTDLAGDNYIPSLEEVDLYRRREMRVMLIQCWLWGCSSKTVQEMRRTVSKLLVGST